MIGIDSQTVDLMTGIAAIRQLGGPQQNLFLRLSAFCCIGEGIKLAVQSQTKLFEVKWQLGDESGVFLGRHHHS